MLKAIAGGKSDPWDIGNLIDGVNKLGALREELKEIADRIRQRKRRMVEDYLAIGKDLSNVRDLLRANYSKGEWNGKWHSWLNTVDMSKQKAGRFIQIYEKYGKGSGSGLPHFASFSIAVELSNPKADPEKVAEVEEEIRRGKKVRNDKAVRERVRRGKSKRVPMEVADQAVYPWVNKVKEHLEKALEIYQEHEGERFPDKKYFIKIMRQLLKAISRK